MGLSKIDICNQALLKIGADTIASLDTAQATDDGVIRSAKLCNILFDTALDEVLRLYPWNCCMRRAKLVRLAEVPAFKYDFKYQLPNDCVRVINVYETKQAYDDAQEWVVEARTVLSNSESLFLKYVGQPDDIRNMDSLSVKALICALAIKLSTPLQLDTKLTNNLIQELEQVILPQARSIDTFENKELALEESYWITSRNYDSPLI